MQTKRVKTSENCVVLNSNSPLFQLEISFFDQNQCLEAHYERNENKVILSSGESTIEAIIQDYNKNKHSLWFIHDKSSNLLACGTGTKPTEKTLELLLSDKEFKEITELEIKTNIKNVNTTTKKAPLLHKSLKKWNIDRTMNTFIGNTIICNIKKDTPEFQAFSLAQEKFKSLSIGYSQAFLPPDSFHMTVLSLINEGNCNSILRKKSNDLNWNQLHQSYKKKLSRVIQRYENSYLEMKIKKFDAKRHFGAIVEPANSKSEQLLQRMHSDFAKAVGFKNVENRYPFHVSLAYGFLPIMPHLNGITDEFIEQLERDILPLHFTLLPPFFAVFKDMGEFTPL